MTGPSLTYAGTSGFSGTDTSREQATDTVRINRSQNAVLESLSMAKARGMTVAELRQWHPTLHHGQLSSALTNLHRDGRVARLTEKRGRAKVYVLSDMVQGRTVEQPSVPRSKITVCPHCGEEYER